MASPAIHIAIAKKYLEKSPNLNYKNILKGTLYPDASHDKDAAHYTNINRGKDNVSHIRGKVNLYSFLKAHENLSDFELGWFLHLVTDYLFFENCFTLEYLNSRSYEDFCQDLYFAYDCLNIYISEKYNITKSDYDSFPSEYYPGVPYEKCILSKQMIDEFINYVSSIDLEKYIKKIKRNKKNVIP